MLEMQAVLRVKLLNPSKDHKESVLCSGVGMSHVVERIPSIKVLVISFNVYDVNQE
jgi:hypothetical protein